MESLQPQECEFSLLRQSPSPTTAPSTSSTARSTPATSVNTSNMSHGGRGESSGDALQPHRQPKITILHLVSDTATSSALPQPFGFSVSRKGRMLAVFSTRNIWLVQAEKLPQASTRTLEVRRRPIAVEVVDDGSLLVVLATPHKVDVYALGAKDTSVIEKKRSIVLSSDASSLALSPDGLLVATGYEYGIELTSLAEHATDANRRTITCEPMDYLSFSDDGRTLLATSSARYPRPSTIFSVHGSFDGPFAEDGELIPQAVDVAWTNQILFPDTAVTAKQATLLQDPATGQVNELFAFNAEEDAWGIYDVAENRFTETKIPPPGDSGFMRAVTIEDTQPTVSPRADRIAVAVKQHQSNSIWVYRLPDSLQSETCSSCAGSERHSPGTCALGLCTSALLYTHEATPACDISAMRWVTPTEDLHQDRLLVTGNITWDMTPGVPIPTGDSAKISGVVIMMDFGVDQRLSNLEPPDKAIIDLDELLPGQKLPEEEIAFEREVELVRTRTVAQRRGEAARAVARNRRSMLPPSTASSQQAAAPIPSITRQLPVVENDDGRMRMLFDEPYSHDQPRSQVSLQRAATVAANSPVNRRHLRALPRQPLEYRRADGLREFPHESDADNWIPPPPPYTARADPPGPGALSISLSGPPAGLPFSPDHSPPAQPYILPRLQIPDTTHRNSNSALFLVSAPAERNRVSSQPTFATGRTDIDHVQSVNPPVPSPRNISRRRPVPSRHLTNPPRENRRPSSTMVQGSSYSSDRHAGTTESFLNFPTETVISSQSADMPVSASHAPSKEQFRALERRESMPMSRPRGALGALGMNIRAAVSAEDLGRFRRSRRPRGGQSSAGGPVATGNPERLATIRSTNERTSGPDSRKESDGTRRGTRQRGHALASVGGVRHDEKMRRRPRCIVL